MRFGTFSGVGLLLTSFLTFTQADDECRSKCAITVTENPIPSKFLAKRSLPAICNPNEDGQCPSDLTKRTLQKLGAGGTATGPYVTERVNALEAVRGQPNGIMFKDDRCTSRLKELGQTSFDFGMSGLCGCTLLIIVSNTHIYGGHYFEDLAFDDTDKNADPPKLDNTADFQGHVINFLRNGGNNRKRGTEGPALAGQQANFPPADTRAYIIAPAKSSATVLFYPDLVNQMAAEVNRIIGVTPTIQKYTPVDPAKDAQKPRPILDTERGRLLYQLDVTDGVRTQRLLWQMTKLQLSTEILP